jgi:hypothetical protein
MRRLHLIVAACAAVVSIAACTNTDHPPEFTLPTTDADVAGTFNLTSANGRALPYTAGLSATQELDVAADQIVIASNNTWVDTVQYVVTDLASGNATQTSEATAGTYTIANGKIQFVMTTGGTSIFAGAVTGNTLTVLFNGQPFVYTR